MKLYRFRFSPFARKVQMLLDLLPAEYELNEVNYVDREELATITGGYIKVPVLVDDTGEVFVESRRICEHLIARSGEHLVLAAFEGAVWAYADFVDGPLEDILFRVASPLVRDRWQSNFARSLFVFIKERKFGSGCIDEWERSRDTLMDNARHLLAPTLRTLGRQPFLFGEQPTLADAALYGVSMMLEEASKELLEELSPTLVSFARSLERYAKALQR